MKNILIVEDDRNISDALRARLQAGGYCVSQAYDASSALVVARRSEPDLVVLDISIPGGDGFLVAQRLRNWKGTSLPLIFLTASNKPNLRERAKDFEAEQFFEKPFDGQALCASVAAAI